MQNVRTLFFCIIDAKCQILKCFHLRIKLRAELIGWCAAASEYILQCVPCAVQHPLWMEWRPNICGHDLTDPATHVWPTPIRPHEMWNIRWMFHVSVQFVICMWWWTPVVIYMPFWVRTHETAGTLHCLHTSIGNASTQSFAHSPLSTLHQFHSTAGYICLCSRKNKTEWQTIKKTNVS